MTTLSRLSALFAIVTLTASGCSSITSGDSAGLASLFDKESRQREEESHRLVEVTSLGPSLHQREQRLLLPEEKRQVDQSLALLTASLEVLG